MSLQTGTEMIALTLLFNKVTGLYSLLAVLTGYHLSALQLSMSVYSIAVLVLLALCMPHIRQQTPLHCLSLAWLYVIDTVVNTAFTATFGVSWYLASSNVKGAPKPQEPTGPDAPEPGLMGAVDSTTSIVLIAAFTLIRVYFSLVVMAYGRFVLLNYMEGKRQGWGEARGRAATSPFTIGLPEGAGWRGRLGRAMVAVGKGYWLNQEEPDQWTKNMNARFPSGKAAVA